MSELALVATFALGLVSGWVSVAIAALLLLRSALLAPTTTAPPTTTVHFSNYPRPEEARNAPEAETLGRKNL